MNRSGMDGNEAGDAELRAWCAERQLPLLAELPFDRAAAEQYAGGGLIAGTSPAWKHVSALWQSPFCGKRGKEELMREIVVISGKGGTGKTSVCAALAHLASGGRTNTDNTENAHRLVICDLDVDARICIFCSLPRYAVAKPLSPAIRRK